MKTLKKIIESNICYVLFCLIIVVINILIFNKNSNDLINKDRNMYNILVFGTTIIELIFCFIINKKINNKYPLEKVFLMIIIPIGLLYMFFIPVGEVPDENTHFARSYAITKGYITSKSDKKGGGYAYLPNNILDGIYFNGDNGYKKIEDNIIENDKNTNDIKYYFTNTSLYNFVVYIPQCIGIGLGNIINLSPLLSAYLGRLFNFFAYIVLIYFSIKLIPYFKKMVALVSLLPISIQEGVSLSSDALTISISLFLISYILYLKYSFNGKIDKKQFVILLLASVVCSLCKIVYVPFILLLFLLPKERFNSKKDKYIKLVIILLISVLINGLWTIYATRYLVETNPGVDSSNQLKYILSNPISYIVICFRTFIRNYKELAFEMLGGRLGLIDIAIPVFYAAISLGLIIILCFEKVISKEKINIKDKIISLIIFVIVIVLIFTSLYIQWTPYKREVIFGIQGRYFIPLIILVPIIFMKTNKSKIKYELSLENSFDRYLFSYLALQLISVFNYILLYNI